MIWVAGQMLTVPPPADIGQAGPNKWVQFFTSSENRHALPLFTSLLNLVCAYDPVGMGELQRRVAGALTTIVMSDAF